MDRTLNIIHLNHREDRFQLLQNQLITTRIKTCIWPGIEDAKNPEKGIAKAHKQIVAYANHQKLPAITIAEDNILFTAPGAFDYYLKHEPEDYDLYLGSTYYGNIKEDNTIDDFAGLILYTIHQRFYKTFLSIPEEGHFDRALAYKGKYVVCNPFVALQHNGFSDNKKKYIDYNWCMKDRELFVR